MSLTEGKTKILVRQYFHDCGPAHICCVQMPWRNVDLELFLAWAPLGYVHSPWEGGCELPGIKDPRCHSFAGSPPAHRPHCIVTRISNMTYSLLLCQIGFPKRPSTTPHVIEDLLPRHRTLKKVRREEERLYLKHLPHQWKGKVQSWCSSPLKPVAVSTQGPCPVPSERLGLSAVPEHPHRPMAWSPACSIPFGPTPTLWAPN